MARRNRKKGTHGCPLVFWLELALCRSLFSRRDFGLGALARFAGVGIDEIEDQGADVIAPAFARKDPVMARAGFEVACLHRIGQAGA